MLKINNLIKYFNNSSEYALQNINFHIKKNDFCIVLGSNGSGKSTLLKCISGEHSINSGKIMFEEKNITDKNRHEFIATVNQDTNKGTVVELNLLENIVLGKLRGQKSSFSFYSKYKKEAQMLLQELGLGLANKMDVPLNTLSGGQRQMVATAMAIHSNPKLLLLDEHTSALDPKMQQIAMQYTANKIQQNNITAMMITHKLDDAIKYGNRLIMLHKGKIVLDLNKHEKGKLTTNILLNYFYSFEHKKGIQTCPLNLF